MALLWLRVAAYNSPDEEHEEHALNPVFEAAGIRPAPCAYTLCADLDPDHSDAFDRAEAIGYQHHKDGTHPPVEHLDLAQPLFGFEHTADMHTLRRYTKHPESRSGLPTVFRHQRAHFIMNGHHGLAGALRRGDSGADAHVIDLDKDGGQ